MKNRVLRFFQKPEGVFHSSVFCQFSGGVGPNAIAIDSKGNVYVAQYDIAGMTKTQCFLSHTLTDPVQRCRHV